MHLLILPLAVAAALLPLVWISRNMGARRDRSREGAADGFLLLGSILLSLATIWFVGVSLVRGYREQQIVSHWRVLDARLGRCSSAELHTGVKDRAKGYELTCEVTYPVPGGAKPAQLRVGYPSGAETVDAWMRSHPEGSPLRLYQNPEQETELWGLARGSAVVTNDAAGARRLSGTLALLSAVLFLLSRAIVIRRRGNGALTAA